MKTRFVTFLAVLALVPAVRALGEGVEESVTVSGTVLSTGNTSAVVKIDDHGHAIPFLIGTTTILPPGGLVVGSHVSVRYHPIGSSGQMADEVSLLSQAPPTALAQNVPTASPSASGGRDGEYERDGASQRDGAQEQPPSSAPEPAPKTSSALPATASARPLVALVGLVALLGSLSLHLWARRRA